MSSAEIKDRIFLDTNIRDPRARAFLRDENGKPKDLVYGIGRIVVPPELKVSRNDYINEAHEFIWQILELDPEDLKRITPKWYARTVKALVESEKGRGKGASNWKILVSKAKVTLGTPAVTLTRSELIQAGKEALVAETVDVRLLHLFIPRANAYRADNELKPKFPRPDKGDVYKVGEVEKSWIGTIEEIIREVLTTGTPMSELNGKIPKPIWGEYLERITPDQREYAQGLVVRIQHFMRQGRFVLEYFQGIGKMRVDEIVEDDIQAFITARSMKYGQSDLNKYFAYLEALFQRAKKWKMISVSPVDREEIKVEARELTDTEHLTPYTPEEIIGLLGAVRKYYMAKTYIWRRAERKLDRSVHGKTVAVRDENGRIIPKPRRVGELTGRIIEKEIDVSPALKIERKVCWYATVFLAVVGARPSEIRRVSISEKTITLNSGRYRGAGVRTKGKTRAGTRDVKLTPTLVKILEDEDFVEAMKKTKKFASRLRQFYERAELGEILPYRFRKSVATILDLIGEDASYALGHAGSAVTNTHYIDKHVFREGDNWNERRVRKFWHWLSSEYFMQPEAVVKDFK